VTSGPERRRPAVFARLRANHERQLQTHEPHRAVTWAGWAIAAAVIVMVIVLALQAGS
jgi:hypothetical protein